MMSKEPASPQTHNKQVVTLLREAGLRLSNKRMQIAGLLFDGHDRHVTADSLATMLQKAGINVSLATVYNTLNQFVTAGLMKRITIDGGESWFDTNIRDHHHLYFEDENRLVDLPGESVNIAGLPTPPEGSCVRSVELMVRIGSA